MPFSISPNRRFPLHCVLRNASEHDIRCSVACAKAAITAVVFCAISAALLTPLENARTFWPQTKYVLVRLELKDFTTRWKSEPCWQSFVKTHGTRAANEYPLSIVYESRCNDSPVEEDAQTPKEQNNNLGKNKAAKTPPAPPAGLRYASQPLQTAGRAVMYLEELANAQDLLDSALMSTQGSFSRVRWYTRLDEILVHRGAIERPVPRGDHLEWKRSKVEYKLLLQRLSASDVFELADFEIPSISEMDSLQSHMPVNLPLVPTALDLSTGVILIEIGLCLTLAYFLLFLEEARHSKTFPAEGTFLGAFNRSAIIHSIFLFLASLPSIACLHLTILTSNGTFQPWLLICTTMIILLSVIIGFRMGQARRLVSSTHVLMR